MTSSNLMQFVVQHASFAPAWAFLTLGRIRPQIQVVVMVDQSANPFTTSALAIPHPPRRKPGSLSQRSLSNEDKSASTWTSSETMPYSSVKLKVASTRSVSQKRASKCVFRGFCVIDATMPLRIIPFLAIDTDRKLTSTRRAMRFV